MQLKLFGYTFKISFLFMAVTSALIVLDETNIALLGILSAIIHETGHLLLMKKFGCPAAELTLNAFDISIPDYNKINQTIWEELSIIFAGSCLNLVTSGVFYLIYLWVPCRTVIFFCLENLFIALFNLLPIQSLDGGQILHIILAKKLTEEKATTILTVFSFIAILPVLVTGFYILVKSKHNFSLLVLGIYLVLVLLKRK